MHIGLRDKLGLGRRELWLEFEGKPIFYGWCSKDALPTVDHKSVWHPEKPFGAYLVINAK
jgi:hypothetical protein